LVAWELCRKQGKKLVEGICYLIGGLCWVVHVSYQALMKKRDTRAKNKEKM